MKNIFGRSKKKAQKKAQKKGKKNMKSLKRNPRNNLVEIKPIQDILDSYSDIEKNKILSIIIKNLSVIDNHILSENVSIEQKKNVIHILLKELMDKNTKKEVLKQDRKYEDVSQNLFLKKKT